jgi:hypothetical protein
MRLALKSLPKGLSKTYERILDRIEEQRHIQRALTWLVYCKRRLQLSELEFAVAIDSNDRSFSDQKMVPGVVLLKYCSSLVKFDSNTNIVELSHFSVREYLKTQLLPDGTKNIYFVDEIDGNAELMGACLACLSFPNFEEITIGAVEETKKNVKPPSLEEYRNWPHAPYLTLPLPQRCQCPNKFLQYAAINWPLHGRLAESKSTSRSQIMTFLEYAPPDIRNRWFELFLDDPVKDRCNVHVPYRACP